MRAIIACIMVLMLLPCIPVAASGDYRLVEDMSGRLWTREEWLGGAAAGRSVKSYGYPAEHGGKAATAWREVDSRGAVVRETVILGEAVALRDFGRHFPALAAGLAAPDSRVFVTPGYKQGGLAVLLPHPAGDRLVRFIMDRRPDPTRPNSHSLIRGYEVSSSQGIDREDWTKVDNFFIPGLHFSEKLIKRRATDLIIIHHTKIEAMTVTSIHDHHLRNGWAGIGYHKVVLPDGTVADGRPEATVGAHARGVNRRSVGVTVVGDFDERQPSADQLAALVTLVADLAAKYRLGPDAVVGHRDVFDDTTCPGRRFPWAEFKQALKDKMGR